MTTSPVAEETVTDLLEQIFSRRASSYTDALTLQTTVTVYLEHKPEKDALELRNVRTGLKRIIEAYPEMRSCKLELTKLVRKDWVDSWKKHFKAIEFGSALLVLPSWSKRRVRKEQALVRIDPGLAFGTGQHPTTHFCLSQLVSRRDLKKRQSFLDLGTGSGILAIAAVKLGYRPVEAIDLDPTAIKVSRLNARRNRVERAIRFQQKDVTKLSLQNPARYDLICANLIADLLMTEPQRITNRLKPDGALVLSGILTREFSQIQEHYHHAGLRLLSRVTAREWSSGCFAFSPK